MPDMTNPGTPSPDWSRPPRLIHLLLALAITIQLFLGSFMRSPHPGRPDSAGFEAHENLGATILFLIILHWTWSCTHPDEGLRHLSQPVPQQCRGGTDFVRHKRADTDRVPLDELQPAGAVATMVLAPPANVLATDSRMASWSA